MRLARASAYEHLFAWRAVRIGLVENCLLLRGNFVKRFLCRHLTADGQIQDLALDCQKLTILRQIPEVLNQRICLGEARIVGRSVPELVRVKYTDTRAETTHLNPLELHLLRFKPVQEGE